jgi:hypothetical protein
MPQEFLDIVIYNSNLEWNQQVDYDQIRELLQASTDSSTGNTLKLDWELD